MHQIFISQVGSPAQIIDHSSPFVLTILKSLNAFSSNVTVALKKIDFWRNVDC